MKNGGLVIVQRPLFPVIEKFMPSGIKYTLIRASYVQC